MLRQRFLEKNHAAQIFLDAACREQHRAIAATRLLGRFDSERLESLGDRRLAFVGGEDSAAGTGELENGRVKRAVGGHD